jgi:hypothetical protein
MCLSTSFEFGQVGIFLLTWQLIVLSLCLCEVEPQLRGETHSNQFQVACSACVPSLSSEGIDNPRRCLEDSENNTGRNTMQPVNLMHEPRKENWTISIALVVGHFQRLSV